MFDKVRKPGRGKDIKKMVNYTIFGFICLMFVFIGVWNNGTGVAGAGTAATVNGTIIPAQDFQNRLRQYEDQAGAMNGLSDAQRQEMDKRMRMRVLENLVHLQLLYQAATKAEVFATAGAIRDLVVNIPAFQNNGRFDREYYQRYLNFQQTTAGDFEGKIGQDIAVDQLNSLLAGAWSPSGLVGKLTKEVHNTKLSFDYVKIDANKIAQGSVTDSEIKAFLAQPANKAQVKADYQSNIDQYQAREEVKARHILIKGTTAASLKKIKDIQKHLTVRNFAEMAKKFSQDDMTKAKGGELGFFGRNEMVSEFSDAAFAAKPGTIVGPVKSPFGYHLILVEAHKTIPQKTFQQVEAKIARRMIAGNKKDQIVSEFTNAIKSANALNAILLKYHLKWQNGGEISAGASYIGKLGLGDEGVTAVISTPPGHIYHSILRSGGDAYLLKTTKVAAENPKAEVADNSDTDFPSYMSADDIMDLWVNNLAKNSIIHINKTFLK